MALITKLRGKKRSSSGPIGYLVFDMSSPDAPYLALNRTSDLEAIADAEYVTLKVIRTKTDSQK